MYNRYKLQLDTDNAFIYCNVTLMHYGAERKKRVPVDLYIYVQEYMMRCGSDKIGISMHTFMIVISST